MSNIDQAEATLLLKALLNNTAYTNPTAWFICLNNATTNPTGTVIAATTSELSGYTRPSVAFTTASAGATSNSATVSVSSMPAATTHSIEIFTLATGTARRLLYGTLTADKTTASGDILSFNSGAITMTLG